MDRLGEYGYGEISDVIDGLAFERMLARMDRPKENPPSSDGKVPWESSHSMCGLTRSGRYMPYCSRICCMYTAKHATVTKIRYPDGQPYVFYMDIRSDSKDIGGICSEDDRREGILYLRGRVSRVFQENGRVKVLRVDTLTGKMVEGGCGHGGSSPQPLFRVME